MERERVNVAEKLASFQETWSPKVIDANAWQVASTSQRRPGRSAPAAGSKWRAILNRVSMSLPHQPVS